MSNHKHNLQVERLNQGEPIISPTKNWWETGVTFNAAAVYLDTSPANRRIIQTLLPMLPQEDALLANGVVAIHYRARPEHDPVSAFPRSFIGLAVFTPDLRPIYRYLEPVLYPAPVSEGIDSYGIEDPRITRFGDTFYMIYCGAEAVAANAWKTNLCLAISDDLLHWRKAGLLKGDLTRYNNKDGVLFPDLIDQRYYLLHRPFPEGVPRGEYAIRLAVSDSPPGPWQDLGEMLRALPDPRFRSSWVGAGSVPIKVDQTQYIEIYHTGNYINAADREYHLGAALLDFANFNPTHPALLVAARLEPFMVPETPAELHSHSRLQVGNVLFACGSYEYQGWIYVVYGGADTYTLAARVKKDALLQVLNQTGLQSAQ